jgi:hypothetical protein
LYGIEEEEDEEEDDDDAFIHSSPSIPIRVRTI